MIIAGLAWHALRRVDGEILSRRRTDDIQQSLLITVRMKTADLIRVLVSLGFALVARRGTHALYWHEASDALVTIPTDRTEMPAVFGQAAIGQIIDRHVASEEDVARMLSRPKPASRARATIFA